MLHRFRPAFAILFALLSGSFIAPARASAENDPLKGDARLERKVAVSAPEAAVSDVLAALSETTGVRLTASRAAADDKIVIFSPARPLRGVLADLAALLNDRWQVRATEGRPPTYTLDRSPGAAPLEQKLLRERQERSSPRWMSRSALSAKRRNSSRSGPWAILLEQRSPRPPAGSPPTCSASPAATSG